MTGRAPYVPTEDEAKEAILAGINAAGEAMQLCQDLPADFCEGILIAAADFLADMIGGYGAASVLRDIADELEDE